jgi:nitrogen-specific signal transduction histidine kinase/HD-like signal output (HDOD) protein
MPIPKSTLNQISTLKHLPTLPHILLKLIQACNRDQGSLQEIAEIIEKDPSLTSRILRLINSAYYALPRKIENMDQAVAYLGTNAIKNMAISASVFGAFSRTRGNQVFDIKTFWWHSLRCAVLARLIAKRAGYGNVDEAFLAGLLHDIGRLVLWVNFRKEYSELLRTHKDQPHLIMAGEIRLGATHCEIGAWLLDQWNLQSFVSDSVLYHHEPMDRINNAFPLVQIVAVANALCDAPGPEQEQGLRGAEEIFSFPKADMDRILHQADTELKDVATSLDIEIAQPADRGGDTAEVDSRDLQKEDELVCEVKDLSLLVGTLQNLLCAKETPSLLKEIRQGLHILFDIGNTLFFLYDSEKGGLLGTPVPQDTRSSLVSGLFLPMKMEKSLLVKGLLDRTPIDSFTKNTKNPTIIVDEQLIRFTGKEGILCLPMSAYDEPVGVIVLGVDRAESLYLKDCANLLKTFTNQAAIALHLHSLKSSQMKTVQSERLGASVDMARRVVHEVNNPLSIIKNYLKVLSLKLAEKEVAQDEIRIINEEIDRVVLLLRELTAFSNGKIQEIAAVNVNTVLEDLNKITNESLMSSANVRIKMDLDPSVPNVRADKNNLKQVFVNLIKNASEAMEDGGNLEIRTRHISTRLADEQTKADDEYGGYVQIVFKDDGPGIPEDIKSKLFEPFVSSKKGTHAGLGLSVVHNIVKSFNGTLSCRSERGKGTAFCIELPVVKK